MEFLSDISGGSDQLRPSFFELAAQEQLRDLLPPVFKYILSVFAQRNPRYLLRIFNKSDELFAIAIWFIERHYLKTWGGSFAENFYGLKRRRVLGSGVGERSKEAVRLTGESEKLGKSEIRLSLVFLVLLPYLKAKALDAYERLGGGVDEDLFQDSPQSTSRLPASSSPPVPLKPRILNFLKSSFKPTYPYLNVLYELYLLTYNIRYIFDKTKYWRPWLSLIGVEVRRMSGDDYQQASTRTSTLLRSPFRPIPPSTIPPSYLQITTRILTLVPQLSFEGLKILLPTAIFFFRFLEWWYSSEGGYGRLRKKGAGSSSGVALRPPPPLISSPSNSIQTIKVRKDEKEITIELKPQPSKKNECVIHRGDMVNITALPTGWLGCYKCLFNWVEEFGVCPIEGTAVEVGELRKIVG